MTSENGKVNKNKKNNDEMVETKYMEVNDGQTKVAVKNSVRGRTVELRHTKPGVHPFDEIEWELRNAVITDAKGDVVFEQNDVEIPKSWSQQATNVVVSKYFRGHIGEPTRERSVKQMIGRVVDTLTTCGREQGYFEAEEDADAFSAELAYLLVHQKMAFNSPVWFNVGWVKDWQGSACFINSVEDTMDSIMDLAKTEVMLFKQGSGAGVNLSPLRSKRERLSHSGYSSGPVSFMKGYDAFAGITKSGGASRRAAKMVILNVDHPDIEEFINCKVIEEKKAWALIEAGYDGSYTGEAYATVGFQNANHSVRVTDEFMKAVEKDGEWTTKWVLNKEPDGKYKARDLMRQMAEAAWLCGDPGLQYDDTIQNWNCVANTARINATNPCFTGDTRVHTDKGLISFKDLLQKTANGESFKVYTHNLTAKESVDTVELSTPSAIMTTGYHEVLKLTFSNGMNVRCTPNHRFWTDNKGYVRADELESMDKIVTVIQDSKSLLSYSKIPVNANFGNSSERKGDLENLNLFKNGIVNQEQYKTDSSVSLVNRISDGVEMTYNLTEPKNNSYILDGFVVSQCSEFVFIDDTSCNLASLNLLKFSGENEEFDIEDFKHAVDITITAQEIIVPNASYPTPQITENSYKLRPLGLGYANLGALLMSLGIPYDSESGRTYAGAITSLMTGEAYVQSSKIARDHGGPFELFEENRKPMLKVMNQHRDASYRLKVNDKAKELHQSACDVWEEALALGMEYGYRNAQSTVLAPTGCLVGGTLISTDIGLVRLRSLGNLDGRKWQDIDLQVATDEGTQTASKFFVNGLEPVVKVKTKRGYEIKGTALHRIKVVDSISGEWVWKRMADIKPLDCLPLSLGQLIGEPLAI